MTVDVLYFFTQSGRLSQGLVLLLQAFPCPLQLDMGPHSGTQEMRVNRFRHVVDAPRCKTRLPRLPRHLWPSRK